MDLERPEPPGFFPFANGLSARNNFAVGIAEEFIRDSRYAGVKLLEFQTLVFTIGDWEPKIGDPSFVGWFTVLSYYLCAGLSVAWIVKGWLRRNGRLRRFRIITTIVILVLGISKQFNLPGAVTEIGRLVADQNAQYYVRRWAQVLMVLFVFV